MKQKLILLISFLLLLFSNSYGQSGIKKDSIIEKDSIPLSIEKVKEIPPQKDLLDVIGSVFHSKKLADTSSQQKRDTHLHLSPLPAVGYSLQTGFAGLVSGNMAFYSDTLPYTKISSITSSITYSQNNQIILPFQVNLWSKGNRFNFISDFRYMKYPTNIYALGGPDDPNTGYNIKFLGIKLHQTVLKSLANNLYMGLGYYYDHFFNIKPDDEVPDYVVKNVIANMGKRKLLRDPSSDFYMIQGLIK